MSGYIDPLFGMLGQVPVNCIAPPTLGYQQCATLLGISDATLQKSLPAGTLSGQSPAAGSDSGISGNLVNSMQAVLGQLFTGYQDIVGTGSGNSSAAANLNDPTNYVMQMMDQLDSSGSKSSSKVSDNSSLSGLNSYTAANVNDPSGYVAQMMKQLTSSSGTMESQAINTLDQSA